MSEPKHTPEAEALADAILKASGSGLKYYSLHATRKRIFAAAQEGIDSSRKELIEAMDMLLTETVDMDLKHGITLSEGEERARDKAIIAIAKALGQTREAV